MNSKYEVVYPGRKVFVLFIGGPADGTRKEMEILHPNKLVSDKDDFHSYYRVCLGTEACPQYIYVSHTIDIDTVFPRLMEGYITSVKCRIMRYFET